LNRRDIIEGLKPKGLIVTNYEGNVNELYEMLGISKGEYRVFITPATKIAIEILGRAITNTAMIGALLKALPIVRMESVEKAIRDRFEGKLAELNIQLIKRAYELTKEV